MKYIIGIDEAGRGPLAGPVSVAAVIIPSNLRIRKSNLRLKDCKLLTPKQRKIWFEHIKNHPKIRYTASRTYPQTIDRINIAQATNLAATRALQKLTINYSLSTNQCKILLDAGIKINPLAVGNFKLKSFIKGDERFQAIKLASIVAKVTRDKYMAKKHKKHPMYNFITHKGYGTKEHLKAIKKHGICKLHRLTFVKKYPRIT